MPIHIKRGQIRRWRPPTRRLPGTHLKTSGGGIVIDVIFGVPISRCDAVRGPDGWVHKDRKFGSLDYDEEGRNP